MNIRIKQIRLSMNINQTSYAELTNTSQSNISKYERGELKPTLEFLISLHEKLNVNINWVLTGKGSMFNHDVQSDIDIDSIKHAVELLCKAIKKS